MAAPGTPPPEVAEGLGFPRFHTAKRAFERDYVERVLCLCGGNVSQAARVAGKDRSDFYDLMRRCGAYPRRRA